MLQLLLRRVHNVNSRNARRHTPLLLALLQRDTRSAEMLLHYGADPNAMDADGERWNLPSKWKFLSPFVFGSLSSHDGVT